MTHKQRGGWRNPASAANGARGGRKRRKLVRWHGEEAVVLRNGDTVAVLDLVRWHGEEAVVLRAGDTVAVLDAGGPSLATVSISAGALVLTNEDGHSLTIVLSE